jgi:hypothetical protein
MKKGAQKKKSDAYERSIAEIFTKAWFLPDEGEFRRVPMSGGWDKRVAPGDVIPLKIGKQCGSDWVIDKRFPFSIECKNWNDANVKHFFAGLYSNESQIFDWMRQASEDASLSKKMPIVIFKLFRTNNICIMLSTDFVKLEEIFGAWCRKHYRLRRFEITNSGPQLIALTFFLLDEFIEWIDWEFYRIKKSYIRSLIPK